MRSRIINNILIILAMGLTFLLALNALGEDGGYGSHKEGYGSYSMMGQDPDEILEYGRGMMRYGFHERGRMGGSNKYPGYKGSESHETVNKLNAEQEAFIKSTEDLRHTIYEKELYLKAELAKKDSDIAIALSLQNNISEARGKFEQKMIEHLFRMKKINLDAEGK